MLGRWNRVPEKCSIRIRWINAKFSGTRTRWSVIKRGTDHPRFNGNVVAIRSALCRPLRVNTHLSVNEKKKFIVPAILTRDFLCRLSSVRFFVTVLVNTFRFFQFHYFYCTETFGTPVSAVPVARQPYNVQYLSPAMSSSNVELIDEDSG